MLPLMSIFRRERLSLLGLTGFLVFPSLEWVSLGDESSPSCSWVWTSIWLSIPLASHFLIRTSIQRVYLLAAPVPSWDLNLILSLLQNSSLTHMVVFFSAITSARRLSELVALSCKEPGLVLHRDKVVLRPRISFLPRVVSAFHLNYYIIVPSFCPPPVHWKQKFLFFCLDVAVRVDLSSTVSFRRERQLLMPPFLGGWSRPPASLWSQALGSILSCVQDLSFYWAFHHQATVSQISKAAWSFIHTPSSTRWMLWFQLITILGVRSYKWFFLSYRNSHILYYFS